MGLTRASQWKFEVYIIEQTMKALVDAFIHTPYSECIKQETICYM